VVVLAVSQHAQLPGTLDLVEPDLISAFIKSIRGSDPDAG
jgi:hypothetical protein